MRELNGGLDDYLRELEAAFPLDLSGRTVVLDCANGATYRAGPAIFERLGAEVETIGVEPDGRNINAGCGSTHMELLAERVAGSEAEIGFAFDGDGDRVLAVDAAGRVHDGDELIALAARGHGRPRRARRRRRRHRDEQLRLPPGDGGGRDRGRRDPGRRPLRDRRDAARASGAGRRAVGPHHRLRLRRHRRRHRRGADDDARAGRRARWPTPRRCDKLPQTLVNVEVADRDAIAGAGAVWEAVEREGEGLEGRGRVLLRPSGTEPLVRVMVEAPSAEEADAVCERLVGVVREELA